MPVARSNRDDRGIAALREAAARTGMFQPGQLLAGEDRGKGGKDRTVRIDHEAARRLDRYLRVRAKHEQAYRLGLWLGTGDRGPLTSNGIYQMVKRRGDRAGVRVYPHRFRHHFSRTWLDRGGPEGDLMELNGWVSPQMLTRYGASC